MRLRKICAADARATFEEYASDPRVTRFLIEPTHTSLDQTERFVKTRITDWDKGVRWTYAILLKGSPDRAVGRLGFNVNPEGVSIGYAFAHRLHGQGLATEGANALCSIGFGLTDHLLARVDTENAGSMRVLEKCGFHLAERRARLLVMPNIGPEPRDFFIYVRDRDPAG